MDLEKEEVFFGRFVPRRVASFELHSKDLMKSKFIQIEPALYRHKWFDYRYLNVLETNHLFAWRYNQAYRTVFRKHRDHKKADAMFLRKDYTTGSKEFIAGLTRCRQCADAMCIPYEFYLPKAFSRALDYWKNANLPQPGQLYTDMVVEHVQKTWEEFQSARMHVSHLPIFKNEAYARAPLDQRYIHNEHHDWLFKQASLRGNSDSVLSWMTLVEEILPIEKVGERLGAEKVERIRDYRARNPNELRYI